MAVAARGLSTGPHRYHPPIKDLQLTKRLASGVLTFLPGGTRLTERSTGGTTSARYCYWSWLRHLVSAARHGLPANPRIVAELGPGDSLGTGIAAMLTGADRYYALDIAQYADAHVNRAVLDGVIDLLHSRAAIPEGEFGSAPILEDRTFPTDVLTEERLATALAPDRLADLRAAVDDLGREHGAVRIAYAPAWVHQHAAPDEQPDMIFSQAVLEHVDDLESTYKRMYEWLADGGMVSHEIDLTSHGFARTWDGHWTHSDRMWSAIRGRRRFAINREPLSTHLELLESVGMRVVHVDRVAAPSAIDRADLAPQFRGLSDDDMTTCAAVVQAVKD